MSRSTQSSTRLHKGETGARKEAKSSTRAKIPSITESITTIHGYIESFVDSATTVQVSISSEIDTICKADNNFLNLFVNNKDGFEKLCSRVSELQRKEKNYQNLMKAEEYWRKLMEGTSISHLSSLDANKRRNVCSVGRNLAASLLITGNIYSGLAILKELVEINDYDPHSSAILLRWLVRWGEWEAMEKFIESDRQKEKRNFEGVEELVDLCVSMMDFHRYPKRREELAIKLMKNCDKLNESKERSFHLYEAQILVYSALSLVSKAPGIRVTNMRDPLYCIDHAAQMAETLAKNRWPSFWFDKSIDGGLKTKTKNTAEYLKIASAVAEYFDLLRMNVNEYVRCGILREPTQHAYAGLANAIKLGFPVWITESFTLLLSSRLRSERDKEEVAAIKKYIDAMFTNEENHAHTKNSLDKGQMEEGTPVTRNPQRSPSPSPHFPSLSSSCSCCLCEECSSNPTLAFFCSKLSLLYNVYSLDSIRSLEATYTRIRSKYAPFQQKLMNVSEDKPRPPSWICDEMGASIVSFLLSSTGISLVRNDQIAISLIGVAHKICSYSSLLCRLHQLALRYLSRRKSDPTAFPWMSRKSVETMMENLSIGSEGNVSKTPTRTPFIPLTNTPNRLKVVKEKIENKSKTDKEDEEERSDYASYSHLLYLDWRSRLCEQLSLKTDDSWEKAMYLSETVAVSTREARRLIDGKMAPFGFRSVEEFKGAVAKIPSDMTVIELIVTMSGDVYLLRVHSGAAPIVVPLAKESKWSVIMEGFVQVVKKSDESAEAGKVSSDAKKYWEGRRKAEEMMRRAMVDMERDLLGAFAPLLLPSRKLTKRGESVVARIRRGKEGLDEDLAREMVSIGAQITHDKFEQLVECMAHVEKWSQPQVDSLLALKKNIAKGEGQTWIQPTNKLPFLFFVISTELSRTPWEAVSILEENAHSSRLISIHQLFSLLNSNKVPHSANPLSAFYILDPANNLPKTKNRLTPVVEKVPSWKGVTGRGPDKEQLGSIFKQNDFYIFLGHGNGLRYMSRTALRKSRCRSVVLLMGCDSVHTIHDGRGMDGQGAVLDFSVASCPCIVGCLYTVTDGEIDKYFTALFEEGLARHLKEDSTASSDLRLHLEAMTNARTKVKLPYLTGSAVVSYGIPIDFRVQNNA